MSQRIKATYKKGAFLPSEPFDLPEGSEVELTIEGPLILPPEITNHEERKRLLQTLVERMHNNSLPASTPDLTRESLHERC